jgi:hypothetical protein
MTSASSVGILFAGPSQGIVAAILIVAVAAATTVLWTLFRLVVDPRANSAADGHEQRRPEWDEAGDCADDDGYALTKRDATG